nr:MAG TPA: hypothetical protein [Caudoviricetes sp.]
MIIQINFPFKYLFSFFYIYYTIRLTKSQAKQKDRRIIK